MPFDCPGRGYRYEKGRGLKPASPLHCQLARPAGLEPTAFGSAGRNSGPESRQGAGSGPGF